MIDANGKTIELADFVQWVSRGKVKSGHVYELTTKVKSRRLGLPPWKERAQLETIKVVSKGQWYPSVSIFHKSTNITVVA